jgi:hypothetical protein
MAKITIVIEDTVDGVEAEFEFDPTPTVDQPDTAAQKVAAKIIEAMGSMIKTRKPPAQEATAQ